MRLLKKLPKSTNTFIGKLYSKFPFSRVSHPIFIIGCGRSGTTIFGTALSRHKDITYLNEPRHLWFSAYPETDIWSSYANVCKGKLFLTKTDTDQRKSRKLDRLFQYETLVSGKPILIEKLPINTFRLDFIRTIFPDARFIHLYRNGLEVAKSIEKLSKTSQWFGANFYKWNQLVDYAESCNDTKDLPEICTSCFDKGLLEWRLSTEAAVKFLDSLPNDAFFEINYDEFVNFPVETVAKVIDFIGVDHDQKVETFVSNTVTRRSSKLDQEQISKKIQKIGGRLLHPSIYSKNLTKCCI